jgi:3-deoxy-D-manno-octulosonic-acid transferase
MTSPQSPRPSVHGSLAGLRSLLRKVRLRILLGTVLEPLYFRKGGPERRRLFLGRWGVYPRPSRTGGAWLHVAGMGEMRVAAALVQALPPDLPVVLTTHTTWVSRMAREALGERAEIAFLPHPFAFTIRRFLRRFAPRQLILVESTDLLPILYLRMVGRELPNAMVNGWFNDVWLTESLPYLPLLPGVRILCVRNERDREFLEELGVSRESIAITGELRFDVLADPHPETEACLQELAGGRPILIAGSTHPDEEPQILDAFERLGGGGRAMLVLAPRSGGSFEPSERLLRERGADFVQRSRFPVTGRPAVVLLDRLGELAALYRLAAAAFVGWSLIPGGRGRNPVEPARFGVPIAVGPNMINFQAHAEAFDRAGAWQRVADSEELARTWAAWLDDPELARQTGRKGAAWVEAQRGLNMAKTLDILRPALGLDSAVDASDGPSC